MLMEVDGATGILGTPEGSTSGGRAGSGGSTDSPSPSSLSAPQPSPKAPSSRPQPSADVVAVPRVARPGRVAEERGVGEVAAVVAADVVEVVAEPPQVRLELPRDAPDSNPQPDFNVRVRDRFDAITSARLRYLEESNGFVQKSPKSTSM